MQLNDYVNKFLDYIDGGKFFKEPMKWLYILCGILPFLAPLLFLIFAFLVYDENCKHLDAWPTMVFFIGVLLITAFLIFLAIMGFLFWKHRKNNLDQRIHEGDDIVAIPVWAHFIQCNGEWTGLYVVLATVGSYVIGYICALLSGMTIITEHFDGEDFIKLLFIGLVGLIFIAVGSVVLGYIIVFLSHLVGESLRIKAQMANDLRDVRTVEVGNGPAHTHITKKSVACPECGAVIDDINAVDKCPGCGCPATKIREMI